MNIKKTTPLILSALALFLSASLGWAGPKLTPSASAANVAAPKLTAAPVGPQVQLPQPKRAWTIMMFDNAKNNLAYPMFMDVNEMEAAGSSPEVNVVVELGLIKDSYMDETGSQGWEGVKRFFIAKDLDTSKVQSIPLPGPAKADMGSYRHLSNFIRYAKKNFPAEKYMLVVSNHGAGMYGISFDDVTGNNLKVRELARAIALNGGVDVYASDACLMQMAEVLAYLKDSAKVVVGSEETVPGNGYQYTSLLAGLAANPGMSAQEAGALVVDTFHKSYAGTGDKTTLSAVDMDGFDTFTQALNGWIAAVQQSPDSRKGLVQAVQHTRSFTYPEFRDLRHFAEITARYAKDENVTSATEELNKALDTMLLANAQRGFKKANGLAVYVPTSSKMVPGYENTAMAKMTDWGKFLDWMRAYKLLTHDVQDAHK